MVVDDTAVADDRVVVDDDVVADAASRSDRYVRSNDAEVSEGRLGPDRGRLGDDAGHFACSLLTRPLDVMLSCLSQVLSQTNWFDDSLLRSPLVLRYDLPTCSQYATMSLSAYGESN